MGVSWCGGGDGREKGRNGIAKNSIGGLKELTPKDSLTG